MPTPANPTALAQQARRSYAERLLGGMPAVVQAVDQGARLLAAAVAEPAVALKRRELIPTLAGALPLWLHGMTTLLRASLDTGTVAQTRLGELPVAAGTARRRKLSLVDDDTIEHEILSSRLALAMMDRASWEFTDLRSRMNVLESREELETNDMLRPHVLARIVTNSWLTRAARLRRLARAAAGAARRALACSPKRRTTRPTASCSQRNVLPEVDLRPFIRRSNHGGPPPPRTGASGGFGTPTGIVAAAAHPTSSSRRRKPAAAESHEVGEETRMMTRAAGLARGPDQAEAVLGRLNRLVGRQLPDFARHLARAAAAVAAA